MGEDDDAVVLREGQLRVLGCVEYDAVQRGQVEVGVDAVADGCLAATRGRFEVTETGDRNPFFFSLVQAVRPSTAADEAVPSAANRCGSRQVVGDQVVGEGRVVRERLSVDGR